MSTIKRVVRPNYGLNTGQNIMHPLKIFIKHLQYKENTYVSQKAKLNIEYDYSYMRKKKANNLYTEKMSDRIHQKANNNGCLYIVNYECSSFFILLSKFP